MAELMPDGRRRSREGWADAMEAGPPEHLAHTHRLPKVVRLAIVGLTGAVFLALVGVGLLATYVYQQQQYIQGRGQMRDRENARLEEQIRQSMCDLLDQLPEGGLLQRPRDKYDCGPGIPLNKLSPTEQAQIRGRVVPPAPHSVVIPPPPRTGPGPDTTQAPLPN